MLLPPRVTDSRSKEGWTRHAQCFDGASEYPDSWCNFGCAVQVGDNGGLGWG